MSIVSDQMPMADAALNARTIAGQKSDDWVQDNLTESQLRTDYGHTRNLISGWWGGSIQGAGRGTSMYPDNNMPFVSLTVSSDTGIDQIKASNNYVVPPVPSEPADLGY